MQTLTKIICAVALVVTPAIVHAEEAAAPNVDVTVDQLLKIDPAQLAAKIKDDKAKATGRYYRLMIDHVKKVLADPKRVVPDYNAKAGYEIAGFVWFQGWNDMVDSGTYPNRGAPGGYDKYSEVLMDYTYQPNGFRDFPN